MKKVQIIDIFAVRIILHQIETNVNINVQISEVKDNSSQVGEKNSNEDEVGFLIIFFSNKFITNSFK